MRRHQAVGAAHPVVPFDHLGKDGEEEAPVPVLLKEGPAGDRSSGDVVRGARDLQAGRSGHRSTIGAAWRPNAGGAAFGTKLCVFRNGV